MTDINSSTYNIIFVNVSNIDYNMCSDFEYKVKWRIIVGDVILLQFDWAV